MIQLLYNLSIRLFGFFLWILGLFNRNIRAWNQDRKRSADSLPQDHGHKIIWVHCASLGEYEQILPLLSAIKKEAFTYKIYLSFFSPSGYQIKKDSSIADRVFYLPLDIKSRMVNLISIIRPEIFIGVKYEFWWNMIGELQRFGTKIIYTNVSFPKKPYFLSPLIARFKKRLASVDFIFTQDKLTYDLLKEAGFTNMIESGDMRIDNVLFRKDNLISKMDKISSLNGSKVFVWGSVYKEDIPLINRAILKMSDHKHFVVPHHVDKTTIDIFGGKLKHEFSLWTNGDLSGELIIVDVIGVLFDLYSVANLAYIGGGHQGRLHNVLEPSVFKIPVYYKEMIARNPEALALTALGLHKIVNNHNHLIDHYKEFNTQDGNTERVAKYEEYFNCHKNSANRVMNSIKHLFI